MTNLPTQPPGYEPRGRGYWSQTPPWYIATAIGVLLAILVIVAILLIRGDDQTTTEAVAPTLSTTESTTPTSQTTAPSSTEETTTTEGSSTSSSTSTSTSTSTSVTTSSTTTTTAASTTSAPTTTTVDPEVYLSAVWPWLDSDVRYDEPDDAAKGFATDFLGFQDPVVGPFLQGDGRSGEVEIRPTANGPVTTILVRLLGPNDDWWVLGAVTENIRIDEPDALEEIDSPVLVSGAAMAFEGVVGVELRADGSETALFESFVTGGGTAMALFEGRFNFANPGTGAGAVVLMTESADDGRPWEAAVVRVVFEAGS